MKEPPWLVGGIRSVLSNYISGVMAIYYAIEEIQ